MKYFDLSTAVGVLLGGILGNYFGGREAFTAAWYVSLVGGFVIGYPLAIWIQIKLISTFTKPPSAGGTLDA